MRDIRFNRRIYRRLHIAISCLLGICNSALAQDINRDAMNDSSTVLFTTTTPIKTFSDCETFKIGLFKTAGYEFVGARLGFVGYSYDIIEPTSNLAIFEQYDILYLPTGWAQLTIGDLADFEANADDFKSFVFSGGSLVVEQPNPFQQANDQVSPSLLPYPILFDNEYNTDDMPVDIRLPGHPLTEGFEEDELPFPADQMIEIDPNYYVLTRGRISRSPALVVAKYGAGKVVVLGYSISISGIFTVSNDFSRALVNWAGNCGLTGLEENSWHNLPLSLTPTIFEENTTIRFELKESNSIELQVFDVRGQRIETIVAQDLAAGKHEFRWQAQGYQSGLYLCKLVSANGKYRGSEKFLIH